MADLRTELKKINLENVTTLLNSGNVIFESEEDNLENKISDHLEKVFGFPVPVVIRKYGTIAGMLDDNPFEGIEITKDIRLYVSFLKQDVSAELKLPWKSPDKSYEIIGKTDKTLFSVLDLSVSKTPKGMDALEKYYGKEITTRNWNTIVRITKKAGAQ